MDSSGSFQRQLRCSISQLKELLGNAQLTTNECLAATCSTLSLHRHHIQQHLLAKPWDTINLEALFKYGAVMPHGEEGPGLRYTKQTPGRDLELLMGALGIVGLCFDEHGNILYESPNFTSVMNFLTTAVGRNLKRVLYNHEEVLSKIFNLNLSEVTCQMKEKNGPWKPRKAGQFAILRGKKLELASPRGCVFLGYFTFVADVKVPLLSPLNDFRPIECVIRGSTLTYMEGRPRSLSRLLGGDPATDDISESVTPDCVAGLPGLAAALRKNGRVECVSKWICRDGYVLVAYTNAIRPGPNETNLNELTVSRSMPVAKLSVEEAERVTLTEIRSVVGKRYKLG